MNDTFEKRPDIRKSSTLARTRQYTSDESVAFFKDIPTTLSMDSKGHAYANIYIERFWRTIKYNDKTEHSSLDGSAFSDVCFGKVSLNKKAAPKRLN